MDDCKDMLKRLSGFYNSEYDTLDARIVISVLLEEYLYQASEKGRDNAQGVNVTLGSDGKYKPTQAFEATLLNDGVKVAEQNNKAVGGGFDLSGKDLKGLNLSGLKITSLNGATVDSGTNFSRCDLTGCDMSGLTVQ